jgi:hypothetical protein
VASAALAAASTAASAAIAAAFAAASAAFAEALAAAFDAFAVTFAAALAAFTARWDTGRFSRFALSIKMAGLAWNILKMALAPTLLGLVANSTIASWNVLTIVSVDPFQGRRARSWCSRGIGGWRQKQIGIGQDLVAHENTFHVSQQ